MNYNDGVRRLAAIVTVALLLGCQQPAPGPAPVGSLSVRLKGEGDALAARGDYEAAAVKYQAAANQEPEDVGIRFALGSALSHLGRREETVEQFRFVVARGKPDSTEVQTARRWLIAAGELGEAASFAPEGQATPSESAAPSTSQAAVPGGRVKGRTGARAGTREVNVVLKDPGRVLTFERTVKLGEAFDFDNVPPGSYQLIVEDLENNSQLWDVQVTVTAGRETVLDLK